MDNVTKGLCYYCYIGPFWLLGLFSAKKKDPSLRFHINQGVVLFAFEMFAVLLCTVATRVFLNFPVVGWVVEAVIAILAMIASICFALWGMFKVTRERKGRLPVIGKINIIK